MNAFETHTRVGEISPRISPSDYLSETSRKVRRALLLSCSVAWALTWLNLIPERIVALGIEFNRIDQRRFVWFILALVVYFLIEFLVLVRRDYLYLLFEEPLLSAQMAKREARQRYEWAFWVWRLRTPELYRQYRGQQSIDESVENAMAKRRFGFAMRSSVFPISRYGFQCWIDTWIPLILVGIVIVSLLRWTPRPPPYIPWP